MSIESAQVNVHVMESLKNGNESLKKLNNIMSVEAVEAILSDHEEEIEKQREIDVLLAGEFSQSIDDELESELEALMKEEGLAVPSKTKNDPLDKLADLTVPSHPVAPKDPQPIPSHADDDDALEELASLSAPKHKVQVKDSERELA